MEDASLEVTADAAAAAALLPSKAVIGSTPQLAAGVAVAVDDVAEGAWYLRYSSVAMASKRRARNGAVSAARKTSSCSDMHCESSRTALSFLSRAST